MGGHAWFRPKGGAKNVRLLRQKRARDIARYIAEADSDWPDSSQLEHIHLSLRGVSDAPSRLPDPAAARMGLSAQGRYSRPYRLRCMSPCARTPPAPAAVPSAHAQGTSAHRALHTSSIALLRLGQGSMVQHLPFVPNLPPAVGCVCCSLTTLCPTDDCVHVCPKCRLPICNQCWAKDAARRGHNQRSRVPRRDVACQTWSDAANVAAASAYDGTLAPVVRARSIQIHEICAGSLLWSLLFNALWHRGWTMPVTVAHAVESDPHYSPRGSETRR